MPSNAQMARVLAVLLAIGLSTTDAPASASTALHAQLESALQDAKAKEYERAIGKTRKLLDSLALNTVEEIILAHKILGVSYCEIGDQPKATEHYEALVTFSPSETIGDLVRTKPCAALFEEIQKTANPPKEPPKRAIKVSAAPIPTSVPVATAPLQKQTIKPPQPPASLAAQEENSAWKRYVPFGVGQFANGQQTKGVVFLTTETAAVAMGLTSFLLFRSEEGPGGTFSHPDRASVYRGLYWGSLGAGIGLAAWGIVDAVIVFHRQSDKRADRRWDFDGTKLAMTF